jgi:hypothetical protein
MILFDLINPFAYDNLLFGLINLFTDDKLLFLHNRLYLTCRGQSSVMN